MEAVASFGLWLSRRRKMLGLSQEDLARRTKCSVSAVRKIEADERRPSLQIAELLAESLEIPSAVRGDFLKVARGELNQTHLPVFAPARESVVVQPARRFSNLPVPPNPLVGRERELAELGH